MNYYSDRFRGGYVVNGWSPAYNAGGTQSVATPVPSGSTERRTFLIASRHGAASNLTITVQGQPFTFDTSNQITAYNDPTYGGPSGMHVIDITGAFNINLNNIVFNIPAQPSGPSNRYSDFAIYRSFNRLTGSFMNARIELNQFNIMVSSPTWQINLLSPLFPVNTGFPVALGLMCGYICDCTDDRTNVLLNGSPLGTIGGHHPSFGTCGGPLGAHLYYDNTFTALLTPSNNVNTTMACADALSNMAALLPNGAVSFTLNFNNLTGNSTNLVGAAFIGYHDGEGATPYECAGCLDLTVTNLQPTSVRLNWGGCSGGNVVSFVNQIRYRIVGNPNWTTVNVGALYNRIPDVIALQSIPPGTPAINDRYIVGTGASGAWTGQDNKIAQWTGSIPPWFFITPSLNQATFATSTSSRYFFNGSTWNTFTLVNFLDIFGLTPGTNYEWQVVNIDTDGALCAPTPVSVFMTPP